jgi:hypothetical protein
MNMVRNLKALVDAPEPEARASTPAAKATPATSLTRNGRATRVRPDRDGQRLIAAHFDGETFKSFKILCAEQGATTQSMVSEAMELLFKKYHKPITKPLSDQAKQRT